MPRRPLSPNSRSDDQESIPPRKVIKKALGANPGLQAKNMVTGSRRSWPLGQQDLMERTEDGPR